MRAQHIRSNQGSRANPVFRNYLKHSCYQLFKPLLLCANSIVPIAIVLSGSPVYAEETAERSPVHTSNPALELNTSLHSDSSSKNPAIAISSKASDEVILHVAHDKSRDASEDLSAASKEPVHSAHAIKQAASSATEPSIKPVEPASHDRIVQTDIPTPEPSGTSSEPASNPESSAASEEPLREGWRFSVEPYFFVPLAVQGDVTVAGRSASINLGLDDVLNLDRAFDAGLRLEAQHDRLGFILDAFYVSAAQSGTLGVTLPEGSLLRFGIPTAARVDGDVSLSVDELTIDAAVSYRVVDAILSNSAESAPYPRLVVAPILGIRTRILWQELEVDSVRIGNFSLPVDREFSSSRTTVEPLLGAQLGLDLSERWAISVRGDVSGFNINADQDFTWNFLIATQYRLSDDVALQLAYRFNGFDFENGEGLSRTRLNLYQNGLWLSSIFRF